MLVPGAFEAGAPLAEGDRAPAAPVPGLAGAVCAGRLACGTFAGGFGPKYLAQSRITTSDRSEATTIRSSCVNLNFFCGSFTNAPLLVRSGYTVGLHQERGRSQICATKDGSAAGA